MITGPKDIAGLDAGHSTGRATGKGVTGCCAELQATCSQDCTEIKRCTVWHATEAKVMKITRGFWMAKLDGKDLPWLD